MARDPYFNKVASLLPFDTLGSDANWRYCAVCADFTSTVALDFPTAYTVVGAPAIKTNGGEASLTFDGGSAIYFTTPAMCNTLCVEFDVYLPSTASCGIIDTSTAYASGSYLGVYVSSGTWQLTAQYGSYNTGYAVTAGWHRIALTIEGTLLSFFVDGIRCLSRATTSSVFTNTVMTLGRCMQGSPTWFTGAIKNFRAYKGVSRYTETYTPIAPGTAYASKETTGIRWQEAGYPALSNAQSKFGGNSLSLNGASSLLGKAPTLGTNDFCIEGWFYVPTAVTAAFQTLAGFANDASTLGAIAYIAPEGRLMLLVGGSSDGALTRFGGKTAITPNAWHHFALVRQGNRAAIFLDGSAEAFAPLRGSVDVTKGFIGSNIFGTTQWVTGYMDCVRTTIGFSRYDITLLDTYLDSVVQHLQFWPGGSVLGILSMERYKTITNNGVTIAAVTGPFGASENAARFNATSTYLSAATHADYNFGTGDFTVECWVKMTGASTGAVLASGINSWTTGAASFYLNASQFRLAVYDIANPVVSAGYDFTTNWHHAALVRRSGIAYLYADGNLIASAACAGAVNFSHSSGTLIGKTGWSSSEVFGGDMMDLRVTKGVARYSGSTYTVPTAHFPLVADITAPTEAFPIAPTYVSGTVLGDTGTPVARRVYAYSRATGALLGSTLSDAGTGAFYIAVPEQCFVVCLDQDAGGKNAIVLDRLMPFAG